MLTNESHVAVTAPLTSIKPPQPGAGGPFAASLIDLRTVIEPPHSITVGAADGAAVGEVGLLDVGEVLGGYVPKATMMPSIAMSPVNEVPAVPTKRTVRVLAGKNTDT